MASVAQSATLKGGYLLAVSEQAFDRCSTMLVNKDMVAFKKMMQANLCAPTRDGAKVYLVDTHVFSGSVEIRAEGSTAVLWTNLEAVNTQE